MVMVIRRILMVAAIEVVAVALSLLVAYGRIEDQLAWFSGMQLFFLLLAAAIALTIRYKTRYLDGTSLTKAGKVNAIIGTLIIIALMLCWVFIVFPMLVNASLRHFGQSDSATITSYRLIHYGTRNIEYTASGVSDADALTLTLRYHNHTSNIVIYKDAKDFSPAYQAAQNEGSLVIRYLPWLPALSRPEAEIN